MKLKYLFEVNMGSTCGNSGNQSAKGPSKRYHDLEENDLEDEDSEDEYEDDEE